MNAVVWTAPENMMVTVEGRGGFIPAGNIYALTRYGHLCMRTKDGFVNLDKVRVVMPNDQAQRPPPETPGRLQESLTNYPNRPTAQRGGG